MRARRTCASRWCTPTKGRSCAAASRLPSSAPTRRQISRPGPTVAAIASHSAADSIPARSSAVAIVRSSASTCASRARPGTTPPHSSWSLACEATHSPRMAPSERTTATPVSSQLVSIPSTVNGSASAPSSRRGSGDPLRELAPPHATALGRPTSEATRGEAFIRASGVRTAGRHAASSSPSELDGGPTRARM